jgi:hypothetical protein
VLARRLIDIYQQAIDSYAQEPLNYKRFSREHEQSRQLPPHWLTEITGTNTEWVESMTAFWQKLSRYW